MHTKIQGHRPFGPREEDLLRFLPYTAMVASLVMWPGPFEQTFIPPSHRSSIGNLTLIGPVVSEEKMFKRVWTTYDGWRRPTYHISSSNEPLALVSLYSKRFTNCGHFSRTIRGRTRTIIGHTESRPQLLCRLTFCGSCNSNITTIVCVFPTDLYKNIITRN